MNRLSWSPLRHPTSPGSHLNFSRRTAALLAMCLLVAALSPPGAADDKQKKTRAEELQSQFLVFGTVFTAQGSLLPGAEIEVRRTGEKKVAGRAISDRRGEFGIRVPKGAEYELKVKIKGFAGQSRKVDARNGERADVVIRMTAEREKKK